MAEMAKPKPRKKSTPRETAAKPMAEGRARTAAKPKESQEPAITTSPKTAYQDTGGGGEHVSITPPAQTKKSGRAWFLSFFLLIVFVGAGHLAWPLWQPYVMTYVPDGLNIALADSRVDGLTTRIGELESKTNTLRQRDEVIARLDGEREKLQKSLAGVLKRIESLEHSIVDVKEMAKAAATVEEAAAASHGLKELYERLEKLETVPVQSAETTFASRLDKLEEGQILAQEFSQRIIELEQFGASARRDFTETLNQLNVSRQTVQALEDRVASVEARPASDRPGTSSVVILAVSELRDAVHQGRAYVIELEAVKAAVGNSPAILKALTSLDKHAAKGIVTLSDLREAFSKLAGTIVAADRGAPGAGWIDRTLGRISSLVKFRRIDGMSEASSTEFLVSRAEKHLVSSDLAAAVRAVERLDNMAKAAASTWLSNAKARLSIEQSLDSLRAHAVVMRPTVKG